jgi:serine/threonine protein phosphatase PrpC
VTVLRAAAATHTGYVRATNQDLALVSRDLVAVADGMGGHLGGEVAARMAIEQLLEAFQRDRTGSGLAKAVRRANRTVWKRSRVERNLHGMGTTLTAAALVAGSGDSGRMHLALANIGDSRAYALDQTTHELQRLTEDHSVVEEMVRQGELTADEAAVHPHRHVLTRALGIDAEVELDVWDLEPAAGSRFLLCSDGLTNELSEPEIGEILTAAEEPEEAARELVGRALGHGGTDNVTVVVLDVLDEPGDAEDMRVAVVPARAPSPETPPGGARDITEAIPITPPLLAAEPGDGPAEASPTAAAAPSGAPGAAPAAAPLAVSGSTSASADDGAGDQNDEGREGAGVPAEPVADRAGATGVTGALDGAAAAAAAAAAVAAGSQASDVAPEASGVAASSRDDPRATEPVPHVGPGGQGRRGRSMTVRSAAVPRAGEDLAGPNAGNGLARAPAAIGFGTPSRPVVLVRRVKERGRDRILTFRVALFVVLIAAVAAGTAAVVIWFEQSSYYVGLDGNAVAIYQGRPSGVLWFKPRLLIDSSLSTSQVLPSAVVALKAGIMESTEKAAEQVVANLANERGKLTTGINLVPPTTGPPPRFAPPTTFGSATSTTVPPHTSTPTLGTTATTKPPSPTTSTTTRPATTTTKPGKGASRGGPKSRRGPKSHRGHEKGHH